MGEEHFGDAVWAGCFMLRLQVEQKLARCDFGLVAKLDKTVNIERTQFKVWIVNGKLVTDKVKRLVNGFPTTVREEGKYDRRQKGNINDLTGWASWSTLLITNQRQNRTLSVLV